MSDRIASDQDLFSELSEPLVQPAPFADGRDPNFSLQINGKAQWEWRRIEENLKKLFEVLQANLFKLDYKLGAAANGIVFPS